MGKILQKYYKLKARTSLFFRYRYLNEVNKLLEDYLTERILQGGSAEFLGKARQDLVAKQNEIKETERMIEFIKKVK